MIGSIKFTNSNLKKKEKGTDGQLIQLILFLKKSQKKQETPLKLTQGCFKKSKLNPNPKKKKERTVNAIPKKKKTKKESPDICPHSKKSKPILNSKTKK